MAVQKKTCGQQQQQQQQTFLLFTFYRLSEFWFFRSRQRIKLKNGSNMKNIGTDFNSINVRKEAWFGQDYFLQTILSYKITLYFLKTKFRILSCTGIRTLRLWVMSLLLQPRDQGQRQTNKNALGLIKIFISVCSIVGCTGELRYGERLMGMLQGLKILFKKVYKQV